MPPGAKTSCNGLKRALNAMLGFYERRRKEKKGSKRAKKGMRKVGKDLRGGRTVNYNYEDHEDYEEVKTEVEADEDDSYLDDDCFCSGCCGTCGVHHRDSEDTEDRDVIAMNNKKYDAAVDAALDAYGKAEEVEIKYLTGFNRAIVGITTDNRVVYGYGDMIAQMMEDDPDCTVEDAIEWIDYNTVRSLGYMGEGAPIILSQGIGEILDMFGPQDQGDGDVNDENREVDTNVH